MMKATVAVKMTIIMAGYKSVVEKLRRVTLSHVLSK
jgi:hypothetical protein